MDDNRVLGRRVKTAETLSPGSGLKKVGNEQETKCEGQAVRRPIASKGNKKKSKSVEE